MTQQCIQVKFTDDNHYRESKLASTCPGASHCSDAICHDPSYADFSNNSGNSHLVVGVGAGVGASSNYSGISGHTEDGTGGKEAVMSPMVFCCQLVQRYEEFRCWAISLVQVRATCLDTVWKLPNSQNILGEL